MSNYDHVIDRKIEKKLTKGNYCAGYPGWNFYGTVWFDKKRKVFCCQIECCGVRVETIEAKTTKEIMDLACATYGDQ